MQSTATPVSVRATPVISSIWNRAPNRSAWRFMRAMSSLASMPSGKPGKFSTTSVWVSWPPGCMPSSTRGASPERAA